MFCFTAATLLSPGVSQAQGFGIETIITFMLVLTIFAMRDSHRNSQYDKLPAACATGVAYAIGQMSFVSLSDKMQIEHLCNCHNRSKEILLGRKSLHTFPLNTFMVEYFI